MRSTVGTNIREGSPLTYCLTKISIAYVFFVFAIVLASLFIQTRANAIPTPLKGKIIKNSTNEILFVQYRVERRSSDFYYTFPVNKKELINEEGKSSITIVLEESEEAAPAKLKNGKINNFGKVLKEGNIYKLLVPVDEKANAFLTANKYINVQITNQLGENITLSNKKIGDYENDVFYDSEYIEFGEIFKVVFDLPKVESYKVAGLN